MTMAPSAGHGLSDMQSERGLPYVKAGFVTDLPENHTHIKGAIVGFDGSFYSEVRI